MKLSSLTAISPIDGRYGDRLASLRSIFSEFSLIKKRVLVEIRWLEMLADCPDIEEVPALTTPARDYLNQIYDNFSLSDAERVKAIEKTTNHDVKAVEYFLKEKIADNTELVQIAEFIHFACTSEDINNLAYALILKEAKETLLLPTTKQVIKAIQELAVRFAAQPMLARTHGQPATPTTIGKEMANFAARLQRQYCQLQKVAIRGKFNGAVGNFNAHYAAYPEIDWFVLSRQFVNNLGIEWNAYSTQIEPHDYIAELFNVVSTFNSILIDFNRDVWGYISLGYFKQRMVENEVGSSTMPHKINPIDFENAEGNLGLANAMMHFLSNQLLTSRWQRDLVDSTLMRTLGVAIAHTQLAYENSLKGINKLEINPPVLEYELAQAWEVLAEPIQTIMRRYGIAEPYEKLKALTRGKTIDQDLLREFVDKLALPESVKEKLKQMSPRSYTGLAAKLASNVNKDE
ncbi:MAG: adenylosuccinate lyase [Legionellales bacterium]|nr:adenylosuccinate lyase [Legionellales bacterium]